MAPDKTSELTFTKAVANTRSFDSVSTLITITP